MIIAYASLEVVLYLFVGGATCSFTSDYYQQLINQSSTQALSYELPKNNGEFRMGINSVAIEEFGEYDVVIVGAGSAGSVVATRLSEVDEISILLLEAGGEEDDFSRIPSMWLYQQFSDKNWGYLSIPQNRSCLGMNNRQCTVSRGKVVGGSSSINGATYIRGNPEDYNDWVALGNRGWSYRDVLPYFKKSENSQIRGDRAYHNKGGFWNVEYSLPSSPLFDFFINASLELNQTVVDYNGKTQTGVAKLQCTIKRGSRQSLGTAFLDNARERGNLRVVTKALVTRVVIDPDSRIAKGVEFVTGNRKFVARAKREVIVSAGAINTPQLLMLSGVGPRQQLEEVQIPVIADLPVGKNLIEHVSFTFVVRTNYTLRNASLAELVDLYLNGLGPLTKGGNADGVAFIRTGNSSRQAPTIQILFSSYNIDSPIYQKATNYNTSNPSTKINPLTDIVMYVVLLHPKSRGQVLLNSSSPLDFPLIDLNMLDKQEDVDILIEGIEYAFGLFNTRTFKKINATVLDDSVCGNSRIDQKLYLECRIRRYASNFYHPCGTAAMGPDRRRFVVDDKLQVHGVRNLRVVDASVFPSSVSGNINPPTVMVAEKAADLIKRKLGH